MTLFSKIINGEIPSYKIAENEKFFAFLDIQPLVAGHTLVIPKVEVDRFFDVPDDARGNEPAVDTAAGPENALYGSGDDCNWWFDHPQNCAGKSLRDI